MIKRYTDTITYPSRLCQEDKFLLYFHRLHQARQYADSLGKKVLLREAERIKEKYLFDESFREENVA